MEFLAPSYHSYKTWRLAGGYGFRRRQDCGGRLLYWIELRAERPCEASFPSDMNKQVTPSKLWLLAAAIIVCLPIIAVRYIPLIDYPNHLARMYVMSNYAQSPEFQNRYIITGKLVPNLAMEGVVLPLMNFFDVFTAGRIFLVLTAVLFALGCLALSQVGLGRFSYRASLAVFLLLNSNFIWGFTNYSFGLGLFLISFSIFLLWKDRLSAGRLLVLTALGFLCFVSHLTSWGFLAVSVGIVSLWDLAKRLIGVPSFLLRFVPILPGLLCVFLWGGGSKPLELGWSTAKGKIIHLLAIVRTYDQRFDMVILLLLTICTVLWLIRVRAIRNDGMLLAGTVLLILFFAMPDTLFASSGAALDARFVAPALLLMLFAVDANTSERFRRGLFFAFAVILTVRTAVIWRFWNQIGTRSGAEVARLLDLPRDAAVYPFITQPEDSDGSKRAISMANVVQYATIYRNVWTPTLYAEVGQPIANRRPTAFTIIPSYTVHFKRFVNRIPKNSYVWIYDERFDASAIPANFQHIRSNDSIYLYRVD